MNLCRRRIIYVYVYCIVFHILHIYVYSTMALSAKHTFSNYRRCPRALYVKHILLPLCVYSIYIHTCIWTFIYGIYICIYFVVCFYIHIYMWGQIWFRVYVILRVYVLPPIDSQLRSCFIHKSIHFYTNYKWRRRRRGERSMCTTIYKCKPNERTHYIFICVYVRIRIYI